MAPKNKAKLKRRKKEEEQAAAEEKEILLFTDLRDWSAGRMERRSFAGWVEENKLVCFNFYMNASKITSPFPDGEEFIWWPELCLTPGSSFRLNSHLHVDEPSPSYDCFREPLIRKEEERRRALGLGVLEEEARHKGRESSQQNVLRRNELQVTGDPSPSADAAVKGLNRNSQEDITMLCQQLATVDPGESLSHATNAAVEGQKTAEPEQMVLCQQLATVDPGESFSHATNAAVEGQKTAEPEQMVVFRDLRKQEDEDLWKEEDEIEWQHIVDKKGKHMTMKELLFTMTRRSDHKFKSLSSKIDEVNLSLSSKIDAVNLRIDEVNTSLSLVAERALRSNFGLFLHAHRPECLILQPLTRLKLAYNTKQSLEDLALLCGKGELNSVGHTPKDAEIDIFVRMNVSGSQDLLKSATSSLKMTGPSSRSTTAATFSHLAVGEVTRTMFLCNERQKYQHPTQRECTSSSKLLYKLVQLERDIVACLDHFSASLDVVIGACVISPSFADLDKPEGVLSVVLSKCPSGLENLQTLYQRGQLWLMDI